MHSFLLPTLSQHGFLRRSSVMKLPWRALRDLDTDELPPFPDWVEHLRNQRLMRNDDVTLVRVEVD